MRLSSMSIVLAVAAVVPVHFALGQRPIRSAEELTEQSSAVWSNIKRVLQANDGDAFFESKVKYSLVPGGVKGVHVFRGTVVSAEFEYPKSNGGI
jgi:hypothetical protein